MGRHKKKRQVRVTNRKTSIKRAPSPDSRGLRQVSFLYPIDRFAVVASAVRDGKVGSFRKVLSQVLDAIYEQHKGDYPGALAELMLAYRKVHGHDYPGLDLVRKRASAEAGAEDVEEVDDKLPSTSPESSR